MKEVLEKISVASIELKDFDFTEEQIKSKWIGNAPASTEEISIAEKRLGVNLPDDYKDFLRICNGFEACNSIEPTFHQIQKIDYLRNIEPELIKIWIETGNDEVGNLLEKSIVIAGIDEEQLFLIIPPNKDLKWEYWKFASWIPGEEKYPNLKSYWEDVLTFMDKQLKKKK
jgi:cell wall assembly regulator SMI1